MSSILIARSDGNPAWHILIAFVGDHWRLWHSVAVLHHIGLWHSVTVLCHVPRVAPRWRFIFYCPQCTPENVCSQEYHSLYGGFYDVCYRNNKSELNHHPAFHRDLRRPLLGLALAAGVVLDGQSDISLRNAKCAQRFTIFYIYYYDAYTPGILNFTH